MIGEFSRSIRLKLVGTVVVAVLVATMIAGAAAAWREATRRLQTKQHALTSVAAALASSVAEPTRAGDRRAVAARLNAIRSMREVQFAIVVDADGRRLHQIGSGVVLGSREERIEANRNIGLFTTMRLGTYLVSVPIVIGGETVGDLAIIADVKDLQRALIDSVTSAFAAGSVAAIIALILAARLQASITAPILALTRVADHVRASGDFTVPAPKLSIDETGHLVDAFNTMMTEINARDRALKRQRDSLAVEVEERTRDLAAAKDAAERANAAKSEFLATMSHEIRTPMNGMLVMAEMLAADDLTPKARRRSEIIVKSGQVLLTLINDILDLSKIEAGRLELERIPCEPAAIVEDVVLLFAERAAAANLQIACSIAPDVPRSIAADPLRLTQIVTNLTSNALKFTQDGGVLLTVRMLDGDGRSPPTLQLAVKDTGLGIAADKLAAIFDAFTQADSSTTRRFGGTGIGLAICRQLATAMDGRITVDSTPGAGSTFAVEIPVEVLEPAAAREPSPSPGRSVALHLPHGPIRDVLAAIAADLGLAVTHTPQADDAGLIIADATHADDLPELAGARAPAVLIVSCLGDASAARLVATGRAHAALQAPIGGRATREMIERALQGGEALAIDGEPELPVAMQIAATFEGVRVLAADDDAVNREVLSEVLVRLGAQVTTVASGLDAIARRQSEAFDIVFMDGSMPEMDGFEASRRIRAWEDEHGAAPVPIVALTAHVIGPQAQMWRNSGMNDQIAKPFRLATIQECLARWVEAPGQATRTAEAAAPAASVPSEPDALLDPDILRSIAELQAPGDNLVARVVGLYCQHAPRNMAAIAACEPGATTAIADAAHALKSLSRNIGAVRVAALCETLETRARSGGNDCRELVEPLDAAVAATIDALRREHSPEVKPALAAAM